MGINEKTLYVRPTSFSVRSLSELSSTLVEGIFRHSYATLNLLGFSTYIHLSLNIVASMGLGGNMYFCHWVRFLPVFPEIQSFITNYLSSFSPSLPSITHFMLWSIEKQQYDESHYLELFTCFQLLMTERDTEKCRQECRY